MKKLIVLCDIVTTLLVLGGREQAGSQTNFWQQTNGPYGVYINSLAMGTSSDIFAGTSAGVFRSTDDGSSWVNLGLSNGYAMSALAVNARGHIFVGTKWGGVFRSTDMGTSWIDTGLPHLGIGGIVIDDSGAIFVGTWTESGDGSIFRSTDNGANWVNIGMVNTFSLAVNSRGTIIAGGDGGIYRSTDQGGNWNHIVFPGVIAVEALSISPGGNIFAGTYYGGIYRSTDDGSSWEQTYSIGTLSFVDVLTINTSGTIFAAAYTYAPPHRDVERSTDNGSTWTPINEGLDSAYVQSFAINARGTIFAGTVNEGVYRSVGSTTSIRETPPGKPTAYSLDQNYPNPFNPTTTINYSIPSGQLPSNNTVTLEVFDVLGKEVATLVNGVEEPGYKSVRWDASGMASGIYFYRLQAGSYAATKKLNLLR